LVERPVAQTVLSMSIPTCSNERANGEENTGHWCAAMANTTQLFPRHQVSIYGIRH
jgi:hypothetical protein